MDIVYFFSSFNKLSLLAFLITLGILVYEIVLLKKEKLSRKNPKIPKFEENTTPQITQATNLLVNEQTKITKPNNLVIIVLIILLLFFGMAAFFSLFGHNAKTFSTVSPTPIIDFVTSKGIKIFDKDFKLITDAELNQIKPSEEIIIGVETIDEADIDRARIRVNENIWQNKNITVDFSPKDKIFYLKYKIATDESKIKIEAQLHSTNEGWLGD